MPGLAKTLAAETLADVVGGTFARIQFTPDLLPSDIVGTRIYRGSSERFDVELGPVFVNFLLADEINRAPAKVQSALLEVMGEQQVTIGGHTHQVPRPFFVVATQNPIESEGVYQLPDAQRDRFMMKVILDHPTPAEEMVILDRMAVQAPVPDRVIDLAGLVALQRRCDQVFVDRTVGQYAVDLVHATRQPANYHLADLAPLIALGVSPRATLGLIRGARALALIRGRTYTTPQDVFDIAPEVLRHRLLLTYDALARDIAIDELINRILATVPATWVSPKPNEPTHPTRPLTSAAGPLAGRAAAGGRRRARAVAGDHHRPARRHDAARQLPRASPRVTAASRASRGRTSPATTCAASTGTSRRGPARPTFVTRSPTATSRPGSSSTSRRRCASARPPWRRPRSPSPPRRASGSSPCATRTASVRRSSPDRTSS